MEQQPFWRRKGLAEMTTAEWESLCDGCGRCCLLKLTFDFEEELHNTDVACRLLDLGSCRCGDYENRQTRVPDCVVLTPDNIESLQFMPQSCAYRLLSEGKDLYPWHPLISGDPDSVHRAGVSVLDKVISEDDVPDEELEDHVVDWSK